MESEINIALIGLIGVALGALFSALGYLLKVRSEQLQNKKSVLFHLLVIRQSLKSEYADPKELTKEYFRQCENYLKNKGLNDTELISSTLNNFISSHFSNIVQTMKALDVEFIKSFDTSISQLSLNDPILAYKLKGREKLKELLTVQNKYIDEVDSLDELMGSDEIKEATSTHLTKFNKTVIDDLINDIDTDIKLVSLSCGILTRWRCRPILNQQIRPEFIFDTDDINELNEFMDDLLTSLVKVTNNKACN